MTMEKGDDHILKCNQYVDKKKLTSSIFFYQKEKFYPREKDRSNFKNLVLNVSLTWRSILSDVLTNCIKAGSRDIGNTQEMFVYKKTQKI